MRGGEIYNDPQENLDLKKNKKAEFKIGTDTLKKMVGAKYNRIVMNMPSISTLIIERSSVNVGI